MTVINLHELKIQEIKELFGVEMYNNVINDADLTYIVKSFTVAELNSNNFHDLILSIMDNFNG
jgi:hypothetical protein